MTDSLAINLTQWGSQRDQRLGLGDDLDQAREIDHQAAFRSRRGAARAAELLEARGFVVTQARSLLRTLLSASRVEALTDEKVATFLRLVIPIVENAGGTYDGFGGGIVPRADG